MAPLVAVAVVSAVSGLAQAYQSEKARGANSARLKQLRKEFEALVPPEYDVSIDTPPQYIEGALSQANFDFSRITPEQFKVVGQYAPEAAEFVKEQGPTLVQGTANQKEGRQAQIEALRQMQLAAKGESPELSIGLQRARDSSQAQAQSRQQSIVDDAQRRGMSGSGMSLAAQMQGTSDSMSSGAAMSQQAAIEAYRQKMSAMQSAGQMGRQLSQDELGMESQNADIINSFNQRTSRQYQDHLNQRAAIQNQAQMQNLNMQQDAANRNVSQNNDAARWNIENRNRLAQQSYGNTRDERNYQNSLAVDKANWASAQKSRQNDLKSRSYNDQMNRVSGMSGMTKMENDNTTQQAQDRNAMVGAIGSGVAGYYQGQAQQDAQREAQDREDDRWDKYISARYGA